MELSAFEKEILRAAFTANGEAYLLETDQAEWVRIGEINYGYTEGRIQILRYTAALKNLWQNGLFERNHSRFVLTSIGLEAAEQAAASIGEDGASTFATPPKAFLCHSSEDDVFVNRLARSLQENGVEVFNDEWEIRPGDSLIDKINEGIAECDVFIAVLSFASLASKWVREELNAATVKRIEQHAKIIPIMLEHCPPPPLLSGLVWVDFSDYEIGLRKLLDGIFRPVQRPALGPPPAVVTRAAPTIPGLTADDEALLSAIVQASGDEVDPQFIAEELSSELRMSPQELNDSVSILTDRGLMKVIRVMGTAPYDFKYVSPTAEAFRVAGSYLKYNPEDDIQAVAIAIASSDNVTGQDLTNLTGLNPARVSRAVDSLDTKGVIKPLRALGTAPYSFAYVRSTPYLRRLARQG